MALGHFIGRSSVDKADARRWSGEPDYDTLSVSTESERDETAAGAHAEDLKRAQETRPDDLPDSQDKALSSLAEANETKPRDAGQASQNRNNANNPLLPVDPPRPQQHQPYSTPAYSVSSPINEENLAVFDGEPSQAEEYAKSDHGKPVWFDDGGSNTNEDNDCEQESNHERKGDYEPSISTWSGTSHFTEINRINLEKQAEGKWDYEDGQLNYLGSIWDLRSRRYECDLCRSLWRRIRRFNPDIKTKFLTKSRCIFKLMELKGRKTDGSRKEVTMLNLVFIYGYKLDHPRYGEWITKAPYIFQGVHRDVIDPHNSNPEDQAIPFNDELWGEARSRKSVCNYDLFKNWVLKCESAHDHPRPKWLIETAARFIDVERKCLIEWDGSLREPPRFVALSYVWGMSQQKVMLTKDRLADFKRPGFFDQPLDQTIRDAFEVVSKMGEKYLWVDALCILQDVHQDKANQIPQMDKIYGSAALTIVAAWGDDANAGLPGVRKGTRRGNMLKLELDGIRISRRIRSNLFATNYGIGFMENYLDLSSMYPSRAWTFQEGVLSTRVLVFTKEQVYFECDRCTWCEETHWESDSIDFISWKAVKNPIPDDIWMDNFDRKAYGGPSADLTEPPDLLGLSYANIVRQYSPKLLTRDEDISNACTGVLASITEIEQSDFFFALRTKHFGNDFLFNPGRILYARFPHQSPSDHGFPSWSWLSWKGQIEITNESRYTSADPFDDLFPCHGVRCYVLEADTSGQRSLRVLNETGGWRFESGYIREPERACCHLVHYLSGWDGYDCCADIPQYSQDIHLTDLESLPVFHRLQPSFHIAFRTFASTVSLCTEDDPKNESAEFAYPIRNLYVCKDIKRAANSTSTSDTEDQAVARKTFAALPWAYERGPRIASLPQNTPCRNLGEDMAAIPDGIYRLLWMNNNQQPINGHLLCKPASGVTPESDEWEGEILQRVCAVRGPMINILCTHRQEEFAARWGLVILG
ncbi:MAG: hypothetical protein L6R41_002134 [Letrouitia leprolyta]|nr:MAG: hypothetical protein L6R41_002134 [Letrouitia leprolyta]